MIPFPAVFAFEERLWGEPWLIGTFGGEVCWHSDTGDVEGAEPVPEPFLPLVLQPQTGHRIVTVDTGGRL